MIAIALIVMVVVLLISWYFGLVKNAIALFVIGAIIIAGAAFALRNKLNYPFARKCLFTICPLNESK